jgi:hypothetical protein
MKMKKTILIISTLISSALFLISNSALAQDTCPEKTKVEGRNIIFVGEVVDMGGDEKAVAFFEYGTSSGKYTQRTQEITLDKPQKYCIKVENLEPCTTYYYRAGMRNKAGESFGAEKEIKTECQGQVLGTTTPTQIGTGILDGIFNSLLPILIIVFGLILFSLFFPIEKYFALIKEKIVQKSLREKIKKYQK